MYALCLRVFYDQVFTCGNSSAVGSGSTEPRQYEPAIVQALEIEMIIDISTGDGHVLALTQSKGRREEGGVG